MSMMEDPGSLDDIEEVKERGIWCDACLLPSAVRVECNDQHLVMCVDCGAEHPLDP